jgi:1-deoxy-D-xylulose-5-phosphate synthase
MIVMSPKDENELKQMLYSAYCYGKPAAIRYPRGEAVGVAVDPEFSEIPIGTWEVLREGTDITLMSCGPLVYTSLEAARDLEKEGISCAVVNARFAKPMDREVIINLATHTRKVLTIEENSVIGGLGSGVMETLSEEGIQVAVKRVGLPDRFLAHGTQKMLRELVGLDREGIKKTIRLWLSKD